MRRQIEADQKSLDLVGAGVFITGGCSQIRGLESLAMEVFNMPVKIANALPIAGVTSAFENPQYATALGLVRYAQFMHQDRPAPRSFLSWLRRFFFF